MPLVRVSVANLVHRLRVVNGGWEYGIALLSPAQKKGLRRYQALGGAAQLTSDGVDVLKGYFGAFDFEKDESTGLTDARFVIDDSQLEAVFNRFELFSGTTNSFEQGPTDDIRHELATCELEGVPPILTLEEMQTIALVYDKHVRQPVPETGVGTSSRERAGIPTRRLFRLYVLLAPKAVAEKIIMSRAVRVLTHDELATTAGGSRKGAARDGGELADNLFV